MSLKSLNPSTRRILELEAELKRMRPVYRSAIAWYWSIKPYAMTKEQQDNDPQCNTTSPWQKELAMNCARAERAKGK